MDWGELLKANFSAISALAGVAIGLLVSLIKDYIIKNMDFKQKQLDWYKEYRDKYFIVPIIEFVDEELQLLDLIYWTKMDSHEVKIQDALLKHRDKEGMIKARVSALRDKKLLEAFENLSRHYSLCRTYIGDNNMLNAYNEKQAAENASGVIFNLIKPQLLIRL